jgi:hypothetical protein
VGLGACNVALVQISSGLRGRWDRNRTCNLRFWRPNPACRGVSGDTVTCHVAPNNMSYHAADCRRVSAVTGAQTGAAAASVGALVPALRLRSAAVHTYIWPDGLIQRLFLAEPVRSVRSMALRILWCKRLRSSRSVQFIWIAGGFAGMSINAQFHIIARRSRCTRLSHYRASLTNQMGCATFVLG